MRVIVIVGVAAGLLGACRGSERVPSAPRFAHVQDLDGIPDLIVDAKRLATSWVVYDQNLRDGLCSLIEGGVPPGVHRVLRFTVSTPNVGTADLFIGNPLDHVFADDGLFEFATCHGHYHFRHYALYELIDPATGKVWRAAKRGFCMIDVTPWQDESGVGSWTYRSCGTTVVAGFQGISVGYADTYDKHLGGQYFVLDGSDGQDAVPPGEYQIRITVNPAFVCGPEDAGRPRDSRGLCHMFTEADYDNNVGEIRIEIPDHPGKTGFGPSSELPPEDEPSDDEKRPSDD